MCLLQMNSSASTEPWTADKRHKTGDVKRKMSKKLCGAYNHTGCKVADECRFVHKYDLRAGANYYIKIIPKSKEQKGLILDSHYPREFKDLRMRNRESMTNTELTELSKMPPLASKVKPTTAKVADSRKKVGPKVSTHVKSEAAKQVSTDMKSELAKPVGIDAKSASDLFSRIKEVKPTLSELVIPDPTGEDMLMLRSKDEYFNLPEWSWWEIFTMVGAEPPKWAKRPPSSL